MNDKFANELTAFLTALNFANAPARKTVWLDQTPKSFGTKIGELGMEVTALQAWGQEQSDSIKGIAEAKAVEETELEQAAFEMAGALVTYLMDAGRVAEAEPFRRSEAWWRSLRDVELLARAQAVIDGALPLTTGPGATAIADDFGISAAKVAALVAERTDYAEVLGAPAAARAARKAHTAQLREKFQPVLGKFRDLDRLVPQFRARPGGDAFVSGWFAARQVVDAGHGPGTGGGGTPPPPPPPPPLLPPEVAVVTLTGSGATQTAHADAAGATMFRWHLRRTGEGEVTTVKQGPENFLDMTELAGTENFIQVIAINAAGEAPESAPLQFAGA